MALGFLHNLLIEHFQGEDSLIDYASWIFFKLFVETLFFRNILPIIFLCQQKGFRHFMKLAVDDFFFEYFTSCCESVLASNPDGEVPCWKLHCIPVMLCGSISLIALCCEICSERKVKQHQLLRQRP